MNTENIENLKVHIYNQLFAAEMYKLLATMAPDERTKTTMLNFASDCANNASFLDRFYQQEMTSSFNPIVQKAEPKGSFVETVLWMLDYESDSFRSFHVDSFLTNIVIEQRTLYTYIAGILNNHGLSLTHVYLYKG